MWERKEVRGVILSDFKTDCKTTIRQRGIDEMLQHMEK